MSTHQNFHHHNHEQREKILPPAKILSRFGLKDGQYLADLGCGQGYFTLKAAEIIGVQGKIKAVDINTERLQFLRQSAQECGLAERIETYLAQGESIPLPDKDVDIALISNVLHELQDPLNYLRNTQRILRNNGEIWVIEWQKKETPMGPQLSERRSQEEWVTILEQAGFEDIWVQIFNPAHILFRGKASESI
ncbi:class I SAM-dependent methyltransferase [Desulfosporosinus metallidurans]|uniref:SAM-dependent methyltransferase n=1 Tax=Desulfosporosinus metallidurans TaxID=1888891 RepID=A0A1Q8QZ25_9FIRM|nr:methyltransferase domain-containing protein [Desulfosporosinus metallidurans]OLN32597.1 SAM-dependent methyltransferase [Desulfosporosinus metallidurans]